MNNGNMTDWSEIVYAVCTSICVIVGMVCLTVVIRGCQC